MALFIRPAARPWRCLTALPSAFPSPPVSSRLAPSPAYTKRPFSSKSPSSSAPQTTSNSTASTSPSEDTSSQEPALPAPGDADPSARVIRLDVSGKGSSVRLGSLDSEGPMGPIVVNRDGTVGRVANWDKMTEHERDLTRTLLVRRNRARLTELRAKEDGDA